MDRDNPRPLAGIRVVVTRAPEQSRELVRVLEHMGAEVIPFPMLAFRAPEDTRALNKALDSLDRFDWMLFTSQNAVRFFAKHAGARGLNFPSGAPSALKIAAVGLATVAAAKEEGFRVDCVASKYSGESLAAELGLALSGKRVLLPRSNRADEELLRALQSLGAEVTAVIAYRTVLPGAGDGNMRERICRGEVDVIAFTSPSAFEHFGEIIGAASLSEVAERVRFAAIGPTTAAAIRAAGVRAEIVPPEATSAALAAEIGEYYRRLSSRAVKQ